MDYFKEGRDWYRDRYGSMRAQRNIALGVAALFALLGAVAVFAVAALAPLKTVEPYVVIADRQDGRVRIMTQLNATDEEWQELTAIEALVESHLVKYVIARETYSKIDLTRMFDIVRLNSSAEVFAEYDAKWRDPTDNPFTKFKDDTVEVTVKGVAFLNENTASVRFRTVWKRTTGDVTGDYIAIARYQFARSPIEIKDRWANPLGFMVTSYRVDQETLQQETPNAPRL